MSGQASQSGDEDVLGPPEYLVYRVLVERYDQDNKETGRTRTHKLSCLTDRHLAEEYDRHIQLPTHWYMYGRTIDEASISNDISFTPAANYFDGQAYYPADQVSDSDFEHLDEGVKDDIFNAAREVIDRYGKKSAEELEQIQYQEYAPNDFIRAYGELRSYIGEALLSDTGQRSFDDYVPDSERTVFEAILDEMLVNFPKEEYELYEIYLVWDDTMRLLYKQGASPRELHNFFESLIQALSEAILRFKHRSHVPEERLRKWRENREATLDNFRNSVEDKRSAVLTRDRYSGKELEVVADAYNDTIIQELEDFDIA